MKEQVIQCPAGNKFTIYILLLYFAKSFRIPKVSLDRLNIKMGNFA